MTAERDQIVRDTVRGLARFLPLRDCPDCAGTRYDCGVCLGDGSILDGATYANTAGLLLDHSSHAHTCPRCATGLVRWRCMDGHVSMQSEEALRSLKVEPRCTVRLDDGRVCMARLRVRVTS